MTTAKDAILFHNGIGNFILATPFFQNLREPEIFILRSDPRGEAIASISPWPVHLISSPWMFPGGFERIFILWAYPRRVILPWLAALSLRKLLGRPEAVIIRQERVPDWTKGAHETDLYYRLLPQCAPYPPRIKTIRQVRLEAAPGQIRIGLCNGSAAAERKWPVEHWRLLARELARRWPVRFVCLGGEGDRPFARALKDEPGIVVEDLIGRLSFAGSADALSQCDLVISNDTALMHAADALGRPVLALWGPTLWSKSRPGNGKVIPVVSPDGAMSSLGVEQVIEAFQDWRRKADLD